MYKLTVKKTVPNPGFSQEALDEYHKSQNDRYSNNLPYFPEKMDKEIDVVVLVVELEEEEFKAMKKSVIEVIQ